ncbi:nitrogenase-stabilizing/protective protein NifW [Altericista sp. CCNU0014]|uniref:nitrogenase-stabilizing/protective protein NifW n=1 Tax=Altericista sp. CCNU0014 TaxID=3082949 RepID=UPI00384F0ABF
MKRTLAEFDRIVDAEQYFEFFELPYDPQVVNVNRLHILKKFAEAIRNIDAASTATTEGDRLDEYRAALESAYEVFLSSNALEQKLFKVFNQKPQNVVMLKDMVIVH